jgi:hypothetical protein
MVSRMGTNGGILDFFSAIDELELIIFVFSL